MPEEKCLVCNKGKNEIPLIPFHFKDDELWICSQHLPILIHKPQQLAEMLPGAAKLPPSEHHD